MITFGDGAHAAMVSMLRDAAAGRWTVELLRRGQDVGCDDAVLLQLSYVGTDAVYGWVLDADGNPADEIATFAWIDYPHIHVY